MPAEFQPTGEASPNPNTEPSAPQTGASLTAEGASAPPAPSDLEPLPIPDLPPPMRQPEIDPRIAELTRQHEELVNTLKDFRRPEGDMVQMEDEQSAKQIREVNKRIEGIERMLLDQRRQNDQFSRATRIDTAIGQAAQIVDQLSAASPMTMRNTPEAKKIASKIKAAVLRDISAEVRSNPDRHGLTAAHVQAAFAREYNDYLDLARAMPNVRAAEIAAQVQQNNTAMPAPSGGSSPTPGSRPQPVYKPGTDEFRKQMSEKMRLAVQERIRARQGA